MFIKALKSILIVFLILLITNCDKKSSKGLTISVAYALGGKGDLSYNDAAFEGVKKLRDSLNIKEFEPATLDDYEKGLEILSLDNPAIIFCIGFLYDEPVKRVANKFPNIKYVVLDGFVDEYPNTTSIKFNAYQGSFLAGIVASLISHNHKVGFIGGADIPIINEFRDGYNNGINFIDSITFNQKTTVLETQYIGSGGQAFTNPVRGREIGLNLINQNCDVLFSAAGSSGNGVIKIAQEKSIFAIGVDVNQRHLAPSTVITSMMKNFDVAMIHVIDLYNRKNLAKGNIILGIESGAVSLASFNNNFSKNKIDSLTTAIKEGKKYLLKK